MFEVFEVGPFLFWTHLMFLLLGVWLAIEFFLRLAVSANLPLQHFKDAAVWYTFAFVFGGRAIAILTEYRVYLHDPVRSFVLWDGNFSFLGGAMGIAVVLFALTRFHRSTFLQWLDALLPAMTCGLTFDWLGKFFAGIGYGKPADVFWAITYDAVHVRYAVPVHPVQLYYAFFYLFLTFLLLVVRKHAKRAGAETLLAVLCASLITVFLEFFRGDFGIPVFAMVSDFILLIVLFLSLGVLAVIELRLPLWGINFYAGSLTMLTGIYLLVRSWLPFPRVELRFSQLLAVLAVGGAIVYVIVHRKRYPHL